MKMAPGNNQSVDVIISEFAISANSAAIIMDISRTIVISLCTVTYISGNHVSAS